MNFSKLLKWHLVLIAVCMFCNQITADSASENKFGYLLNLRW